MSKAPKNADTNDGFVADLSPGEILAQRIRSLRKMAGLTQEELAAALCTSRAAIAFLETARAGDIQKYVPRMAVLFGIPEEAFLNGLESGRVQANLTPDEADLIKYYRCLMPTQKLAALGKVRRMVEPLQMRQSRMVRDSQRA